MAWIQGYECLECNQRIWWSSPQKCERPCENGDKWKRSFRMSRMCNIIPIRCTKMMALYEWPWGTKFSLHPSSIRYRCIWRFCYELSYCIVFLNIWYVYPQRRSIRKNHQKIGWYANLTWDEVSDPIAIMCTYGDKQWSGYAKVHIKNVQEDGVKLLQGLRPFIIRLSDNKMHKTKFCKSWYHCFKWNAINQNH